MLNYGIAYPQMSLEDIENHFAKDLGFEEHQRVVGVYKDTEIFLGMTSLHLN